MKLERLNKDKIRIIFDYKDLAENNINIHSFMSNSIETQKLFLQILDKAEEILGFETEEYELEVNTLALNNGNFILIITRLKNRNKTNKKVIVHTKRKTNSLELDFSIYHFNTFEDFFEFCCFLTQNVNNNILLTLENCNSLYKHNNQYFLSISTNKLSQSQKEFFFSTIVEFANFVSNSQTFLAKLEEGTICFLKNNAIKNCIK